MLGVNFKATRCVTCKHLVARFFSGCSLEGITSSQSQRDECIRKASQAARERERGIHVLRDMVKGTLLESVKTRRENSLQDHSCPSSCTGES